jgi:replicative DNA helicase
MFKALRDSTNSTIFAVHHLTKESESKWNKEAGYEPKINHIRGSSRIADFANQVILLHRPDNYDDIMEEARRAGKEKQLRGLFIVDIAANRDGDTGKIIMRHDIAHCFFHE